MIFSKPPDINKSFILNYAPIFVNLKRSEKKLIIQNSEVLHYRKGASVYKEGDPPDGFYCVISGRVKISRYKYGREEILEFLTSGMYFGIVSLLTTQAHSVSAQAINDSLILKIKKDDFHFILAKIPQLAIDLSKTLSKQIRSRDYAQKAHHSNIISIYSAVSGLGRTMYAINLAISLRKETKKKVIFLDFSQDTRELFKDFKFDASTSLRVDAQESINLKSWTLHKDMISRFIIKDSDLGIDLLNVAHNAKADNSGAQISPLLTLLTDDYHYVILDLPIENSELVFNTLAQSDAIHLITDYNLENIDSTKRLMADLFKTVEYPQEKIKVILNEKKDSKKIPNDEVVQLLSGDVFANVPVFGQAADIIDRESIKVVLTEPDSEYARVLRRISRQIGDVLVGLALGGGAAFGLAHIGVIKVLEKENIPIDVVAGSSMGALIAALWALGKNASEIEKIMMEYNNNKGKVFKLLGDFCFPRLSLVKGNEVMKFIKRNLSDKTFHDIKLSLLIVASNLDKRQKVVFENGKLADAVRSSIAIPGIFRPTILEGNLIIDGGIFEPVPIQTLVDAGIKKIIAVNVLPSPADIEEGYKNYKYYLEKEKAEIGKRNFAVKVFYRIRLLFRNIFFPNILDIMVNSLQSLEYVIAKEDFSKADVVLSPIIPGTKWFEFFKTELLIKKGEMAAENALAEIKELINR